MDSASTRLRVSQAFNTMAAALTVLARELALLGSAVITLTQALRTAYHAQAMERREREILAGSGVSAQRESKRGA